MYLHSVNVLGARRVERADTHTHARTGEVHFDSHHPHSSVDKTYSGLKPVLTLIWLCKQFDICSLLVLFIVN